MARKKLKKTDYRPQTYDENTEKQYIINTIKDLNKRNWDYYPIGLKWSIQYWEDKAKELNIPIESTVQRDAQQVVIGQHYEERRQKILKKKKKTI